MADPLVKAQVVRAIGEGANNMAASWDSPLAWSQVVSAIADIIVEAGGGMPTDHFATLLTTASMAQRRALEAETEVAS